MPKLKVANRFGIIPNALLNDPNISWKAKGLFGYLQSKPDDWDFAVNRIAQDAKDGRDGTSNGLVELEKHGYLHREKYKNDKGQWDIEYTLFDVPSVCLIKVWDNETITEKPSRIDEVSMTENPSTENPSTENTETIKERSTKKEIVNKKYKREDFLTWFDYLDIKVWEWIEKGTFTIYMDDPFLNAKIIEFTESRKQLKKPMTPLAIEKLIEKVKDWFSSNRYTNIQIGTFFDRSIECGWQWVFEQGFATQYRMQQKNQYEKKDARTGFVFSNNQQ